MREIGHFIGGKAVKGASGRFGDVFDPNTGEVQAKVALAKQSEVEHAIADAQAAQPGWAATNPQRRARVMFKFLELIQKEFDTLAKLLSSEHGKTDSGCARRHSARCRSGGIRVRHPAFAEGRIHRRCRSCNRPYSIRQPLGVVAGFTPFNFAGNDSDVEIRPPIACNPASTMSSARRIGTEGSRSDGLRMKAFPHAIAGANFHIGIIAGKLNGVIPATTPSGWRIEYKSMAGPAPSVNSPFSKCGMPHANSTTSTPR